MVDTVLHLPYAHLWLPAGAACAIATVVYWVLTRNARPAVAPDGAGRLTVDTAVAPPADADPFAQGSASEQRASFRRTGNPVEIIYASAEIKHPRRGYVLDRSVGGLRLMLDHDLAPDTVLMVRPANVSEIIPETEIVVRSCRPSATQPGQFDLGCQFVKSPPYSLLLLFG